MQVVLLFAVSALGRVFHLDAVEITSVYYSNSGNLIVPLVDGCFRSGMGALQLCLYERTACLFLDALQKGDQP